MKSESEDIEMLARAILTEARDDSEHLQAEAKEKADAIRKRAREQAEAARKEILERARQEADRLRGQAVATAQLKARSLQLEHREKLLDRVFKAAGEKLTGIPARSDYEQVAGRLLDEALNQLKVEKAEVRADAATQKVLKESLLNKKSKERKVELALGKPLTERAGLVVAAVGGHLQYDNTFETRLSRLQNTLRSSVYQVLTGEKL